MYTPKRSEYNERAQRPAILSPQCTKILQALRMERVGLCLVVFFLALAVSETSKCYSCTSLMDNGCGDDKFDTNSKTMDCATGRCLKTKAGDLIVRTCGILFTDDDCIEEGEAEVCTCKGELCNGATVQVVSMATLTSVVFINVALRFM